MRITWRQVRGPSQYHCHIIISLFLSQAQSRDDGHDDPVGAQLARSPTIEKGKVTGQFDGAQVDRVGGYRLLQLRCVTDPQEHPSPLAAASETLYFGPLRPAPLEVLRRRNALDREVEGEFGRQHRAAFHDMHTRRQCDFDGLASGDRTAEDWGVGARSSVEGHCGFEPLLVSARNSMQLLALFVPDVKGRVREAGLVAVDFERQR